MPVHRKSCLAPVPSRNTSYAQSKYCTALALFIFICISFLASEKLYLPRQALGQSTTSLIVVYSSQSFEEASDIALYFRPSFPNASVMRAPNGYFAVVLGTVLGANARSQIASWIAAGAIPSDTFPTTGVGYSGPFTLRPSGLPLRPPPLIPPAPNTSRIVVNNNLMVNNLYQFFNEIGGSNYLVYTFDVPAFQIGVVTMVRRSGSGEADLYVVEAVERMPDGRIQPRGVIARSTQSDSRPNVVALLPASQSTQRVLYIPITVDTPGEWSLYFHTVDPFEHLARAGIQAVMQEFVQYLLGTDNSGGMSQTQEVVFEALESAWEFVNSDSVISFGLNSILSSVRRSLIRSYPDSSFLINTGVNFVSGVFNDIYRPAFRAMQQPN